MADEPTQPAMGTEPAPSQPEPAAPAPAADPAPAQQPVTGTGPEPPAPPSATDDPAAAAQAEAAKWKSLARKHEDQNKATRAELDAIKTRVETDQAERQRQMDALAVAFGLKPEEVTPEQLAAERDAERTRAEQAAVQARAAAVELAVFRAAAAANANGNALLDSRAFVGGLAGMDPAAPDFGQQVADKIAAALEVSPGWKLPEPQVPATPATVPQPPPLAPPAPPLPPAVPASGPQPGSYGQPPAGPRQLSEDDAKQMSPSQVLKAINDGLFVEAGFGPNRVSRIR